MARPEGEGDGARQRRGRICFRSRKSGQPRPVGVGALRAQQVGHVSCLVPQVGPLAAGSPTWRYRAPRYRPRLARSPRRVRATRADLKSGPGSNVGSAVLQGGRYAPLALSERRYALLARTSRSACGQAARPPKPHRTVPGTAATTPLWMADKLAETRYQT